MKPYLSSEAFEKEEGFSSLSPAALAKEEYGEIVLHSKGYWPGESRCGLEEGIRREGWKKRGGSFQPGRFRGGRDKLACAFFSPPEPLLFFTQKRQVAG